MPRYFIEVAYKGTNYSGFQIQDNAPTIQSFIQDALQKVYKINIDLTGSSRTDAGVHAKQNFFHLDTNDELRADRLYNINAILPTDIVVKDIKRVADDAHARFDAISRIYQYHIHQAKNPFINDTSWFYPYTLQLDILNQAAELVLANKDFTAFAKRNSQVNNHNCTIISSQWMHSSTGLYYEVSANRFLRGMVRALTATMLKVARNAMTLESFKSLLQADALIKADFAAPAHGLTLIKVDY